MTSAKTEQIKGRNFGRRLRVFRSALTLSVEGDKMKTLLTLLLCALLLVLCWPLAFLVLIAWPFVWLLSIPFRIVGTILEAMLALLKAILFLPARLLGYRDQRA
jgi:hypothetical protein